MIYAHRLEFKILPKKYALRSLLNMSKLCIALMWYGRAFQSSGPLTLKDLEAKVFIFGTGTTRPLGITTRPQSIPSRYYSVRRSTRYCGAVLFRHLWTMVRILKIILNFTGSQCRVQRHWVQLSYLAFHNTSFAAMFWTACNFLITTSGSLTKRTFVSSMCEITMAIVTEVKASWVKKMFNSLESLYVTHGYSTFFS